MSHDMSKNQQKIDVSAGHVHQIDLTRGWQGTKSDGIRGYEAIPANFFYNRGVFWFRNFTNIGHYLANSNNSDTIVGILVANVHI